MSNETTSPDVKALRKNVMRTIVEFIETQEDPSDELTQYIEDLINFMNVKSLDPSPEDGLDPNPEEEEEEGTMEEEEEPEGVQGKAIRDIGYGFDDINSNPDDLDKWDECYDIFNKIVNERSWMDTSFEHSLDIQLKPIVSNIKQHELSNLRDTCLQILKENPLNYLNARLHHIIGYSFLKEDVNLSLKIWKFASSLMRNSNQDTTTVKYANRLSAIYMDLSFNSIELMNEINDYASDESIIAMEDALKYCILCNRLNTENPNFIYNGGHVILLLIIYQALHGVYTINTTLINQFRKFYPIQHGEFKNPSMFWNTAKLYKAIGHDFDALVNENELDNNIEYGQKDTELLFEEGVPIPIDIESKLSHDDDEDVMSDVEDVELQGFSLSNKENPVEDVQKNKDEISLISDDDDGGDNEFSDMPSLSMGIV